MIADLPNQPAVEILVENDADSMDRNRTAAWSVSWRDRSRFALVAEFDMLTHKRPGEDTGLRADQLTVAAGGELGPLTICGGLRLTGNLGGMAMQNALHDAVGGSHFVDWDYDRTVLEPLVLVSSCGDWWRVSALASARQREAHAFVDWHALPWLVASAGYRAEDATHGAAAGTAHDESGPSVQLTATIVRALVRVEIMPHAVHLSAGVRF